MQNNQPAIGATALQDGSTCFRVWAPRACEVAVVLPHSDLPPLPLQSEANGYFSGTFAGVADGARYYYLLDAALKRPDPASRYQPEGVHGPSQVVDLNTYQWMTPDWRGLPLEQFIIYELHVGTFTREGTFDGVISRLDYLCELGVTAVELMPVAQFPGERNWGYDGTFPFAVQNSYGGPDGLRRLVDACHARGLAVILDVVYNHLGPEGNYLHAFGPYFTDRYQTPWGDAVNFDGPDSDPVRQYFITNALYWIEEFQIDALRLDAVHGIYDFSACHILQELAGAVQKFAVEKGRKIYLIAESDLNDVRLIKPPHAGGFGLDAQWNDDFHHALRSLLTNDRTGYYQDFGTLADLVKSYREGFVLDGAYSTYRKRRHGSSSADLPTSSLVVFSQNHDQVGNRMHGERLTAHLSSQQLLLAAATVLLSPYIPLLFMGEEYAESAPFPYFVSHGDADLVAAVQAGRQKEFAAFTGQGTPPDPQAEATFLSAKLNPEQRHHGQQHKIFKCYSELIRLRKEHPALADLSRERLELHGDEEGGLMAVGRSAGINRILCLFNFSNQDCVVSPPLVSGSLRLLFDSTGSLLPGNEHTIYGTRPASYLSLPPYSCRVYRTEGGT